MEEVDPRFTRVIPDLVVLAAALLGQTLAMWWLLRRATLQARRVAIVAGTVVSLTLVTLGFLLRFERVLQYFPGSWPIWERTMAIMWVILSLSWLAGFAMLRVLSMPFFARNAERGHSPARRHFLVTARTALFAAPPAVLGYGVFIERSQLVLREQKLEIPGLPADLDGVRLVQLTDIHLSPFLSKAVLERAVAMANETRAQVALVTGDLITTRRDPLDDCLQALGGLRADAGVFGCMGNHEVYARSQEYTEREGARRGLLFLRQAARPLRFGNATLNLAGVDYQNRRKRYLEGAEKMIVPGAFNVLLSHNPDVFRVAARQGYPLTISGHTHGGQVRTEILHEDLNIARFYTPYVDGVYREGAASIFVSRGIGTIGIPVRIGAPPEVALLHLCRA